MLQVVCRWNCWINHRAIAFTVMVDKFEDREIMLIKRVQIENFRLLRSVSVGLEDRTTLIVGRNNCGKTSMPVASSSHPGGAPSNAASKNVISAA